MNKIFLDRCLVVFWIWLGFWIWNGSKYTELHKVLNKTFHQRYLTVFSICLEFWIYQCYTGFCRKQHVIHLWQVSEYSWAFNMLGLEYARVVNMPRFCVNCILKILSILNVLSSEYAKILNAIVKVGLSRLRKFLPN